METYNTKYGLITLYKNDFLIGADFKNGGYWDIDTLFKLREYIDPNRNILEIGGHCGTSSIIYASFLNEKKKYEPEHNMYNLLVENINQNIFEIEGYKKTSSTIYSSFLNEKKIYVYEPQRNMYNLLVQNINQNNLQNKIIPHNLGVFCFEGKGKMNNIELDGRGAIVSKRYNEENNLDCNFGAIPLGDDGEDINLTTIDNMKLDDIGFIHCDAEGSENFIFSKGIETIKKCRPVILYENKDFNGTTLYDNVCKSYPNYKKESMFDIKKYCMEQLNYSTFIDRFNNGSDTLLIP
jgi:FkbM family methyltransferase